MRAASIRSDRSLTRLRGWRVFLDGVEIACVLIADEEEGMVEIAARDGAGRIRLTPDGREVLREVRRGVVRIEPPAGLSPQWLAVYERERERLTPRELGSGC